MGRGLPGCTEASPITREFPWQPWILVRGRHGEWRWLEAVWMVTQAPAAQAPEFGLLLTSDHAPLQKPPRGIRVWQIKLRFESRRPGLCLCRTTDSPSAHQGRRRRGGGKAKLPLCTGFSVWKMEMTPPIRKAWESFVHHECKGLPGTGSQKQAPEQSPAAKCHLLSCFRAPS